MSSSSRPPHARHRFGFRGKRPGRSAQATTTDEILESLTRQAELIEDSGRDRTLGLETILESESSEGPSELSHLGSSRELERLKPGKLGKFAFAVMLLGGLTFLWIYSKLSQALNPQSLADLQKTIMLAGFRDWEKIALIMLCAVVAALFVRRSRSQIRSRSS